MRRTCRQAAGIPAAADLKLPHFAPKAKRAIYLFMSGAPPQIDLWDYKPNLAALYDKDIPDSVRGAQQLTGMTAGQARFPIAPSHWAFKRYGKTGTWVSDLLPNTGRMVDDLAIIKSTNTEAINHEPAIMLMNTGNMNRGQALPGLVARLWPGQHERQSAHVHGAAEQAESQGEQSACLFAAVEQRLSFVGVCRVWVCARVATRCCFSATRMAWTARCAARCSTR